MKVVMTYCHKDWNVAFAAVKVLLARTLVPAGKLVLYGSEHAPGPRKDIGDVEYLKSTGDPAHYPLGSNVMFAGLMAHAVNSGWDEPVFMVEPDGFPTRPDWYERVLGAHLEVGTHVSGSWIDWVEPKHYNGNMVIDPDLVRVYPCLARPTYTSWDCFHAELLGKLGANNVEIVNPRRDLMWYPSEWWWNGGHKERPEHVPAWVHGYQGFGMWERIAKGGF